MYISIDLAFDLFDPDSEGFISAQDLEKAILTLGINKVDVGLHNKIKSIALSNPMISFSVFEQIMSDYNPTDSVDDIKVIFKRFDFGNKGYIDSNDIRKVAEIVGEQMTDKEINDLLKISPNH